ncbi:MAG: diaminopimelate decarboxylase [Caulobacteraceae bacterium]
MNHFDYLPAAGQPTGGPAELFCEGVPLSRIAAEVGTPTYVYSTATLTRHFTVFRDAFAPRTPLVAYAVKANASLSVLRTLAKLGAGADTVSEGEIRRAIAAGIPASRIVFSGVGKTDAELSFALDAGIAQINVEAEPELDRLAIIAGAKGVVAKVVFRVNPDVGAGGHAKISTGKSDSKFGVSLAEAERLYAKAAALPQIEPVGVGCHIGSQILDLAPMEQAFCTMRALVERLRAQGHTVTRLDLGGGLGVPYGDHADPPSPLAFAAMVNRVTEGLDVELEFEPGRLIAANAGVLLSRVIHIHERPEGQRFVVLDAAMNDLLRPAMYDAHHEILAVVQPATDDRLAYDVVGPVCETGDTFARDRPLPPLKTGDLVAFMTAGAYGASMASEYNARPLVAEVLVKGGLFAVTRARPTYEQMMEGEVIADWL